MRKVLMVIFAGVFVLPHLCESYVSMEAKVERSVDSKSDPNVVKVTLEGPAANEATLRLASSTGNIPVSDHKVESGATTCTIPATGMPSGVYQVTLIENGTVTGTQKFTK